MNLGETVLAAENSKKAYDLRARVSERERFYIDSHYLHNVVGDLGKASEVYELWSQTYPDDVVPAANLGDIYTNLGQYDRALAEDLRAFRVDPTNASNYADRVADYIYLNRLEEAEITAKQALSKNFDSPKLHARLYLLAFQRNDESGMAQQVSWSAGKPGVEDILFALEAQTAAYNGRLTTAREFSRRAVTAALNSGHKEIAAKYEVSAALRESLIGEPIKARGHIVGALALSTGRDVQAAAALTLALIGEAARSQKLASDLEKRYPVDTIVQFNYLPAIRGSLALDNHDSGKAIAAIEAAAMYELGDPADDAMTPVMCAVYVRGQAYLAAGDGKRSAVEFRKILDHPGVVQNGLIGALARLQVGRAYVLLGDKAKARAAYKGFFVLWKDADPDIPILKHAKAEYAKLE